MDALSSLQKQASAPDPNVALLQSLGIAPTTSTSTTTSPYSSGTPPLNIQSGTEHSAILQRLTEIGTKIDNMGAQIMAKLSNKPASGGRRKVTRKRKQMKRRKSRSSI